LRTWPLITVNGIRFLSLIVDYRGYTVRMT
jgi:hypothetical protein